MTFLLKFLKKDQLMQKRHSIFVESLVVLDILFKTEEGEVWLAVDFGKERLTFCTLVLHLSELFDFTKKKHKLNVSD